MKLTVASQKTIDHSPASRYARPQTPRVGKIRLLTFTDDAARAQLDAVAAEPGYTATDAEWSRVIRQRNRVELTALPAILAEAGLPPTTRATYSRRAYCRCGCSPCFILDAEGTYDIFVDLTAAPEA